MRWIICGIAGILLWGQGGDPLRDSLLVENERIEYLELGIKPYLPVISFEVPKWEWKLSPEWGQSPNMPMRFAQVLTPARPTWPRLDPVHLRYSVGRYWTQEAQVLWNTPRALTRDAGVRFHHRSTPQGHVPQARWGTTTLAGWGGYYGKALSIEGQYEGSYQTYRLYAPYAERWGGYDAAPPLPDSLKVSYFRQQVEVKLQSLNRRPHLRYRMGRIDFRTGVPEWLHFVNAGIAFRLPFSGEGEVQAEAFGDGRRYSVSARPLYRYQSAQFEIVAGLQVSYARAGQSLLLVSPMGEAIYKGWSPWIRPFIKADANIRPVTYFYQLERNPYLRRMPEVLPFERTWTQSEIGVRGQGRGWDYRVSAEYALRNGVPLFTSQGAAFRIDTIARLSSIGILMHFLYLPAPTGAYGEARLAARHWRIRSRYGAFYGEAPVEGALRVGYRVRDRWHFWGAITVLGPRQLAEQVQAPAFVDISWRIERQVLPVLALFVEVNNLLNQRFYRWYGYRERPLDFSFGIWTKIG